MATDQDSLFINQVTVRKIMSALGEGCSINMVSASDLSEYIKDVKENLSFNYLARDLKR